MNYEPKVSIIIPVYNGANFLRSAIDSALNQTYPNCEVIVVNDGSKDNGETEAIALSYGDQIYFYSKQNGGCASALNLGISKMKGDFFSWLSHDDLYLPDKITDQIQAYKQFGLKDAIVFSGYQVIDNDGNWLEEVMPHQILEKDGIFDFQNNHSACLVSKPLYPLLQGIFHGCALLIPKHLFEQHGHFDESKITTQDYALWFDFLRRVALIYDRNINVQWRNHPNQNTHTVHSLHIRECNSLWIGFIDALTTKEKELLDGSEQQFLKNIHKRLSQTPYDKAKEYAHNLLLKTEPQKSPSLKSIVITYVKPITPVFLWSLTRAIYLKIRKFF